MSKKCTPLWREAHFEVKMYKTHQLRTTFGSWDVEKVHAIMARSAFGSQMRKAHQLRTTFGSWDVEKVHAVVVRSTFRSQNRKNTTCSDHFWTFTCRFAWQAQGILHLVKSENIRDVRRSGRWFPERVAFGSIRSSGLLRWFCVTRAALRMTWHHFFLAGAVLKTGGVEKLQSALARGRQLCIQLSIFEGSLAELLRFWCCQLGKKRKSRRIASFLMLSSTTTDEVSQNSFVSKLAEKTDR